jgi:DNA-binding response OmpR family regulator
MTALTHSGVVVLAIDNEDVRNLISSTLRKAGFKIVSNPDYTSDPDAVDVGLANVDADAERGDGARFVSRLREMRPDLPLLLLSESPDTVHPTGSSQVLRKPFRRARLLGQVMDVVGERTVLSA